MSNKESQDETSGFVVESSDMPEVETAPQEETEEEQASSEAVESEGDDNSDDGKESDSSAEDASEEHAEEVKPAKGVQKRINKVVKEREDARRDNEALQKRIKELEGDKSELEVKEPVEEDFDTYDKYLDALDKYDSKADTKDPAKYSEKTEQEDTGLTDNQRSAMAVIRESIGSAENKPGDFEAVALNHEVPITGEMLEALAECDDPAKVMYHLGKHKDIAESIANKSPAQQMREIAKLDLTVKVTPPKPVKTTNAPDPISPVNGSEQQTKSDSEMSFPEFEAADRERNSKRKSTW